MIDTPVKRKVTEKMGPKWTHDQVSQRAGVGRVDTTRHLLCTGDADCQARHTPAVQVRIAQALGTSVGELFGDHAWFRLAARKLEARLLELRKLDPMRRVG